MKTNIKKIFHDGLVKDNAVFRQILGICSALAVTNLMMNSLVMGLGLMFSTAFSCATYSALRSATPKHIRMMVQTLIISAYVIILDIFLKAYWPDMSKALGPYVGLIITNCIIMGRCEAYAQKNPPPAFLSGRHRRRRRVHRCAAYHRFFQGTAGFRIHFRVQYPGCRLDQLDTDDYAAWRLLHACGRHLVVQLCISGCPS